MTQNELVVEYLKRHQYITRRDAMIHLGIGNLPARINEIRTRGMARIVTETSKTKSRYAMYRLATEEEADHG